MPSALGQRAYLDELVGSLRRSLVGEALAQQGLFVCKASDAAGFDIAIVRRAAGLTVALDEWIEHFDDEGDALELVAAALDGDVRLRVDVLSGRRWRWTLQRQVAAGRWAPVSTISHATWRFWGRAGVVYLCNGDGNRRD